MSAGEKVHLSLACFLARAACPLSLLGRLMQDPTDMQKIVMLLNKLWDIEQNKE